MSRNGTRAMGAWILAGMMLVGCGAGGDEEQGCDSDDDCAEFELPCGLYSSVHKMMCGTEAGDL